MKYTNQNGTWLVFIICVLRPEKLFPLSLTLKVETNLRSDKLRSQGRGELLVSLCHQVTTIGKSMWTSVWLWAVNFHIGKSRRISCSCSAWCKPNHSCSAESEEPPQNGHHRSLRWEIFQIHWGVSWINILTSRFGCLFSLFQLHKVWVQICVRVKW